MIAVSSMHEEVHQRTKEQWQINERTECVRSVFNKQEHCRDQEESSKNDTYRRCEEASHCVTVIRGMICGGHHQASSPRCHPARPHLSRSHLLSRLHRPRHHRAWHHRQSQVWTEKFGGRLLLVVRECAVEGRER